MGKVLAGVGCLVGASVVIRLWHGRRQQTGSARRAIAAPTDRALGRAPDVVSAARGAGDEWAADELALPTGPRFESGASPPNPEVKPGEGPSQTTADVPPKPKPDNGSPVESAQLGAASPQSGGDDEPPPSAPESAPGDTSTAPSPLASLPRQALFDIAKDHKVPPAARLTMSREELIDAIRRADA